MNTRNWTHPPFMAVALLSASALAYEVLLFRLYAMIQWHHFAGMIISQALLGFGVSGIFLLLFPRLWRERMQPFFTTNLWLFAFAMPLAFLAAQQAGFNTLEIFTDWRQWLRLAAVYLCLATPFFFIANCVGAALSHYSGDIPKVYAFDLTGAGLGALGIVLLLWRIGPAQLPWLLGALVALGGFFLMQRRVYAVGLLLLYGVTAGWGLGGGAAIDISPYKGLSQTLRIPGTQVIDERHGPQGWLAVVDSPQVPLRIAPGMSISMPRALPDQRGLFIDGEGPLAINRLQSADDLAYLDALPTTLVYALSTPASVFIAGAGGGMAIQQAWRAGADRIRVAEANAQLIELLTRDMADYWGWPLLQPRVELLHADSRGAMESGDARFDLVLLTGQAQGGSSLGAHWYTVEALQSYLAHLETGGLLVIALESRTPPRDTLKLVATAARALGDQAPAERIALLRGWRSALLLVSPEPWPAARLERLRTLAGEGGFDLAYLPGLQAGEANRFNMLREPFFFQGATALLGPAREDYVADYKFDLTPATDDRPFFEHFFKWRILPEIWEKRAQGSFVFLDAGYPLLWWQVLQALVFSGLLILLPLGLRMRGHGRGLWRWSAYFAMLGLGFLMIEMAFIEKLGLILLHPVYSAAAVLSAFLVFAGLGSLSVPALTGWTERRGLSFLAVLVALLAAIVLLQAWLFPHVFAALAAWPLSVRLGAVILMLAPVAYLMGMPFPYALERLAGVDRNWLPWAWGINGFASVVASPLALIVAMDFGFNRVMLIALGCYVLAAGLLPRSR